MPSPIVYLTADQILELHRLALTLGGVDGVRSEHGLMSAVFQPQQSVFGEDAYPSLAEKAAAYAFFIAENQPFLDGNKRTAALALTTFLDLNGHELWESVETELATVLLDLGNKVIDQSEFFGWVLNHTRARV